MTFRWCTVQGEEKISKKWRKYMGFFVYSSGGQKIQQVSEISCEISIPGDNKNPTDHNPHQSVVVSLFSVHCCVWFCLCFYSLYLDGSHLSWPVLGVTHVRAKELSPTTHRQKSWAWPCLADLWVLYYEFALFMCIVHSCGKLIDSFKREN